MKISSHVHLGYRKVPAGKDPPPCMAFRPVANTDHFHPETEVCGRPATTRVVRSGMGDLYLCDECNKDWH